MVIRRQHGARAVGYSIYENESGMPLRTIGEFDPDPALLGPMLSSCRTATRDRFGSGTRSVETEQGNWLCVVPGEYTTMLAAFSSRPTDNSWASSRWILTSWYFRTSFTRDRIEPADHALQDKLQHRACA